MYCAVRISTLLLWEKSNCLYFEHKKEKHKDRISLFAYNWFVTDKVQCHKWKPINYRCHSKFNEAFGLVFLSIKCQGTGRLLILNSCGSRSVLKFPSGLSTKLKPSGKTSKKHVTVTKYQRNIWKTRLSMNLWLSNSIRSERSSFSSFEYTLNHCRHPISVWDKTVVP